MAVNLPDHGYLSVSPALLDFGGTLSPILGGPDQRIVRLGSRFQITITTEPMLSREEGRVFRQRLMRAKSEGAITRWPLDFAPGDPGSPVINGSVTGGSTISIRGLTPGYTIREGQFFSIIRGARRYMHSSNSGVTAGGATATLTITPMLRVPLLDGDTVELAEPMIQGLIDGDALGWERAAHGKFPFTYTIREME